PQAPPGGGARRAAAEAVNAIEADKSRWPTLNLVGSLDRGACEAVHAVCETLGLQPRVLDVGRLAPTSVRDATATTRRIGAGRAADAWGRSPRAARRRGGGGAPPASTRSCAPWAQACSS